MKAGTLEIEIIAQVAKLQEDMRKVEQSVTAMSGTVGKQTKAVNDNLRNMGKGAGAGLQQFSRDVANLKGQLDPAWAATQRYKEQVLLLRRAFAEGAITAKQYVAELRATATAYQAVGKGVTTQTNAQRAGFQQLSMQINDVSTMYAMGARPMQIYASQIGQVIQAVQLMTNGTSRLAAFLGGPWGVAITTASILLVPLIGHLFDTGDAAEDAKGKTYDFANGLDVLSLSAKDALDAISQLNDEMRSAIAVQGNFLRQKALIAGQAASDIQGQLDTNGAELSRLRRISTPTIAGAFGLDPIQSKIRQLEDERRALQKTLDVARTAQSSSEIAVTQSRVLEGLDAATAATGRYERAIGELNKRREKSIQDPIGASSSGSFLSEQQYATEFERLTKIKNAEVEAANASEKTHRTRRAALSDTEKAYKRQYNETERFVESLQDEIARIGLDEKALRQLEIAKQMDAAQTEAQRKAIAELNVVRERALALQEAQRAAKANGEIEKQIAQAQRELSLIGMTGVAREKAAVALAEQVEIEAVLVELQKAEADGNADLIAQLQRRIELIREKHKVELQGIDMADEAEKTAERLRLVNEQLVQMIGLLGNLGTVGGAIGGILGVLTGNTAAVGGPVGQLLNAQIGTQEKDGKVIARTIGDEISDVFKKDGEFGKTMQSVLQGAGTGILAGNALGVAKGTEGQIGSAIGGALGKEAGDALGKAVGGTLGNLAGPLGSVLGGVLGGVLGSMFTSVKWGRANVSQAGVSETSGNSNSSERAALAAGNSVFGALSDIADAFGGSVGDFGNIAVGVRHGDYRVNLNGTSLKKKKGATDFNDDAEAAIAFAIQSAIDRGAIEGVRAATSRLLKSSDDLQKNIEKALKFEGVFSELKSLTDPLGYALENLTKEFDALRKIFDEAGASAEEYAQLEELLARKRQDAIESNLAAKISELSDQGALEVELLRLLGREEDALALSRLQELAATKSALQPMQALIYQLQDARTIIEQFAPLSADLKAFKAELLGGSSVNSFAHIASQFRATAAGAVNGDAGALANLRGDASAYLEAAKANAGSQLEFRRALGEVLAATDGGIFAADSKVEYAQLQIDAIAANTNVLSDLKAELATYQQSLVEQGEWVQRQFRRWDADGIPIRSDADNPVFTETAA